MLARHRALVFGGTAALLVVGLTASAAYAAGSAHRVGPHRATVATWSVNASFDTEDSVKTVITDHTTGTKIKCGLQFNYTFVQKMGLPGDDIATLNGLFFNGCKLPGGTAITLTSDTANVPIAALSFNPRRNLGVTTGAFTGIDISLSGSGCSAVLDGSAAGANDGTVPYRYYNNPGELFTGMPGDLHSYNVSGCAGLFGTDDSFSISTLQDWGILLSSP